ncbi:lysM domain-containing protein [Listeria weihenstephanensis FSL R9-0317]|uniref:LysM domain-containing protein n=1 Tax=Listeria weihenstephanensis TaxID=1006155 RepID=A0A1S7FTJ8_9LIST|nr:LysM peptidoglycan-binding domain-containing protein [Listeria weihenstephanensis]AQY50771.1 hypothetical protein UE46_06785 [Listeria weihenstephanensis]EUJ38431.1 lysM domain-containing protein [Listeria weihenstephanensis FSL R9-0317]
MVKKEDENMGKEDDQEFKQLGEETDDDYIDSIPSRSQSRRANKSKKAIFRYPILNLLIIFFLLIPIVCLGVYLFVLNFGSNTDDTVKTETTQTTTKPKDVNIASNEEKVKAAKEKAAAEQKQKEEDAKKAALEKQQAEEAKTKEAADQKAAAEKAEADRIAAAKAEETRKQEEAAAAEKAEQDRIAAEAKKKEEEETAAKSTHTVVAGDTLYKIARQAYGNSNVAANVAKIKQANGLSADSVPIGTVLKIPQ